ncbi:hypothetical protein HPB50_010654 [Hyalomma asiaticum]|uniref:Uncharacterized protein n=1 Tax=Hyalomma asiaticum TaxID=266040 RepID=A0ACB7T6U3_HYAAI|nr:hypothetical protein HPB50_010654 [Hyalomma asiaticum]
MDSASDMSSDFSTPEYDRRRSESFWAVWILAMLVMMLFIITALFILWLWSYLQDNDGPRRDALSGVNHRIDSSSPRETSKAATRESRWKASLVLYPTTSVLGSRSRWPSPSRMMGVSDGTSGPNESSSSRSFCHLFLPVTAVSVAIANVSVSCDANAIQRVSTSRSFLSDARLSMLCRSWDPSSWKVSWHRYHSYACGFGTRGKAGIVYQTPEQALRLRRELLTLTHYTCFGFLGGHRAFPRECREILP